MHPDQPTDLGIRVAQHFARVHREVFLGDPVSNARLKVEVIEEAMAHDTPMMILITPWTINGLAFPPDGTLPEAIIINGRSYPVFQADIDGIGLTHSVNLVATVAALTSPEAARSAARAIGGEFRKALARAREASRVADPGRRELFGRIGHAER